MKLVKPSFEIKKQKPELEGIYKQIEWAGRTCYKSHDKMTEDSAKKFVDRMIKNRHCYTGDSEVLTELGWKKWSEYNGEKVAVVNLDGTFKGYEIPINIINKEYFGKFYEYNTIGIKVTDGHRMFGMFANSAEDRYKDFEGELFTCNTPYQDANKRNKTLGERWFKTQCVCNYNNVELKAYYQLIGFWLGDGCRDNSKNKLRFHLKKDKKVKYLTDLCLNLGFEFQYNNYHFDVIVPEIGDYFNSTFVLNSEKYIDLNYTEDLNEIYSIIDGLLNSDGSFQKTGTSFSSTSPHLINYIYSKGPLVGYNVSVGKWKKELLDGCKQVERLFILKSNNKIVNDSRKPESKVIISKESLQVYCVTVSTGLIMVRGTNGVVTICGNCAMLEHGTVYLSLDMTSREQYFKYCYNKFSKANSTGSAEHNTWKGFITTNLRVLVENDWMDDLQYICEPTEYHEKRITVKFITDQGILREFTRHRTISFACESTRYCNYSLDKFDNNVTFIIPEWCKSLQEGSNISEEEMIFFNSLHNSEMAYFDLLKNGWKPQQARNILPLATKCELIMTGFVSDWKHFFSLRASEAGATGMHPQADELASPLYLKFKENEWI